MITTEQETGLLQRRHHMVEGTLNYKGKDFTREKFPTADTNTSSKEEAA